MIVLSIPGLRIVSEQNQREHWTAKNKRRKAQQEAVLVELALRFTGADRRWLKGRDGMAVRFHRYGPGLLDDDNLTGGFKHCRDALAKWFDRDDADPWFRWVLPPTQERHKVYAVHIELEPVVTLLPAAGEGR